MRIISKAKSEHILIFEKFMAKHEDRKPNFEELLKWEENRVINHLENDSKNKSISAINKNLGFKPKQVWITWEYQTLM